MVNPIHYSWYLLKENSIQGVVRRAVVKILVGVDGKRYTTLGQGDVVVVVVLVPSCSQTREKGPDRTA